MTLIAFPVARFYSYVSCLQGSCFFSLSRETPICYNSHTALQSQIDWRIVHQFIAVLRVLVLLPSYLEGCIRPLLDLDRSISSCPSNKSLGTLCIGRACKDTESVLKGDTQDSVVERFRAVRGGLLCVQSGEAGVGGKGWNCPIFSRDEHGINSESICITATQKYTCQSDWTLNLISLVFPHTVAT